MSSVNREDVFAAKPDAQRRSRQPSWEKFTPFVWAPIMYTSRFWLKDRVQPRTQHAIFMGMVLVALAHAGVVMGKDNTMRAGG